MQRWIRRLMVIGGAVIISIPTLAATPIQLNYNGKVLSLNKNPILKEERVLLPLRELGEQFDYKITWDSKTRQIFITYQNTQIKLTIGNTLAYINGNKVELDVAPQLIEGITYVPIRFISEAFNKRVNWDKQKSMVSISEETTYEVNPQTSDLIKYEKGTKKVIGKIRAKYKGKIYIGVQKTDKGHEIITVDNNYGEPSIIFDRTIFYMDGDKVLGQTMVTYRNRICEKVHYLEDRVALTDGEKAYIYNDETGNLIDEYDLQKLMGDGNYEIEASGKDFLLVREEQKGILTFIDLAKKKWAPIYEVISLSEQEKQYALYGKEPAYDGIVFEKKEGNALYFKYSGLEIRDGKFVYYMKK